MKVDKDPYILKAVGIRMKDIRICLGLNRTDFSKLTKVNISSIQDIENGIVNSKLIFITKICERLNLSIEDFFNNDFEKIYFELYRKDKLNEY